MIDERDEPDTLLNQLERENGGPVEWKTYGLLLRRSEPGSSQIGGLLYIVKGNLIFEDFEPKQRRSLFPGAPQRNYKKTKLQAPLNSIASLKPIPRKGALRVLEGKKTMEQLKSPSGLQKIFDRTVYAIEFTAGEAWLCELFDAAHLRDYMSPENVAHENERGDTRPPDK